VRNVIVRPLAAALLIGAALSGLGACSTDKQNAKPAALAPIATPIQIRRLWEFDLGSVAGTFMRPSVQENAIFAASAKGELVRIDPSSGKEVWRVRVDDGIAAGVGSDGSTVAVVGPRGNIEAFDAGGKHLWTTQAPSDVIVPPLVGHELVLVRSTDQRITAYEAASGKRRWVFERQQPSLVLRAEAGLAFAGDNVVVGFPGGRLDAVALGNGAGKWEAPVSEPRGATEIERLADVMGLPSLSSEDVCAASYQGRIGCFDARNGDLRWAREFSAGAGVGLSGETVVGVDAKSNVNAFTRASGAGLWQSAALINRRLSAPVMLDKVLALGDFEGTVHFLRIEDGKIIGRVEAGGGPVVSAPVAWNGAALVQTASGRLMLLSPLGG
jgi:outer membrane protein assembly factor BamB